MEIVHIQFQMSYLCDFKIGVTLKYNMFSTQRNREANFAEISDSFAWALVINP